MPRLLLPMDFSDDWSLGILSSERIFWHEYALIEDRISQISV